MRYNVGMRQLPTLVALATASLLAGCGLSHNIEKQVTADASSLADRCGEIMKKAMPFAEIDIGDRSSASTGLRTIIAKVTGKRTDLPDNGQVERDLAVECTFDDNVLTAFRWTRGGPPSR
jgi:hypothetical protein